MYKHVIWGKGVLVRFDHTPWESILPLPAESIPVSNNVANATLFTFWNRTWRGNYLRFVHLARFSSNQLYEYFTELIAYKKEMEEILNDEDNNVTKRAA